MSSAGRNMPVSEQIAAVDHNIKSHLVILGAGASFAALPTGDKNGKPVPLLKDVAEGLNLTDLFPVALKAISKTDFESAYSRLYDAGPSAELDKINGLVWDYFSQLELPEEPNLYDVMNLSLRRKDAIATFNWDPFLIQSQMRLAKFGLSKYLPRLLFLHGNVLVGYCEKDQLGGRLGNLCSQCHQPLTPSQLLYPVEHKDYQSDAFTKNQWAGVQQFLKGSAMFTVFGYSAPVTDKEAIDLLKEGWGDPEMREYEQTEIVNRPGSDEDELRETWKPFINSHHYYVFDDFYKSFLGTHPRRSIESWWNQFMEIRYIEPNTIPKTFASLGELVDWFGPLLAAEGV